MAPGSPQTKRSVTRPQGLVVYTGCYRGWPRANGVFLIYSDHGADVFHLEPLNLDLTPGVLRDRNESPGRRFYAGGYLSTEECDFTLLIDIEPADVRALIQRWAATPTAWARREFPRYLDAEILIDHRPSPFGAIRDVIARPSLIIN